MLGCGATSATMAERSGGLQPATALASWVLISGGSRARWAEVSLASTSSIASMRACEIERRSRGDLGEI